MKVTALDIRRKEFRRSMRGYSDEEVDLFLDEVADEFGRLFEENAELRERVRIVEEQLAGTTQLRAALEKTLVSAQIQADQTKANAQKESEQILRDAELKGRGILNDSYTEVQRVQQALIQLKRLEEDFRLKFRSLLEGHLKLLEEAPLDMAAQPVMESAAAATEETPFVVPPALDVVPEYPPAAPDLGASIAAEPAAGSEEVVGEQPAVTEPALLEPQSVSAEPDAVATEAAAQQETADEAPAPQVAVPQVAAQSAPADAPDISTAEGPTAETLELPTEAREQDPLSGFFFSGLPAGTEETLPGADQDGKSKARDFEW